jgi:hypothetical protein
MEVTLQVSSSVELAFTPRCRQALFLQSKPKFSLSFIKHHDVKLLGVLQV